MVIATHGRKITKLLCDTMEKRAYVPLKYLVLQRTTWNQEKVCRESAGNSRAMRERLLSC